MCPELKGGNTRLRAMGWGSPNCTSLRLSLMKLNTILRYPKPGRFNPTVRAFSATVKGIKATPRASQLNPPAFFDNKERIIYSVVWATNNEVKEVL